MTGTLIRMLRMPDVTRATGLARSTIYKLIAEGSFPAPRRLTGGTSGWRSDEVQEWIDGRPLFDAQPGRGDAD